jgi:creatinine amidohydrolase
MEGFVHWCEMTGPEVARFAQQTDVAILPVGCVEMHGPHLPTGTDGFTAQKLANMIARREPCIVLPPLFYNTNHSMRKYPGTIGIPPDVVKALYEAICDEAARNGFRKIAILICHGSSEIVAYHLQNVLFERSRREDQRPKPYSVFVLWIGDALHQLQPEVEKLWESAPTQMGHGGEMETSLVLAARPDLVKPEQLEPLPEGEGPYYPKTVQGVTYPLDWIKQVPRGYIGTPHLATAEKGKQVLNALADYYARVIRCIRDYDPERDI